MGYDDAITSTFRDTVRRERERRGWTQTRLAQEMTKRGIPTAWPAINKLETGKRNIPISEAVAIADAFGISTARLIGDKPRPAADRDFMLRQLQEAVVDAHRTARTSVRDISNSLTDITDTEIAAAIQTAINQLDHTATELARLSGVIAEARGNRIIVHSQAAVMPTR